MRCSRAAGRYYIPQRLRFMWYIYIYICDVCGFFFVVDWILVFRLSENRSVVVRVCCDIWVNILGTWFSVFHCAFTYLAWVLVAIASGTALVVLARRGSRCSGRRRSAARRTVPIVIVRVLGSSSSGFGILSKGCRLLRQIMLFLPRRKICMPIPNNRILKLGVLRFWNITLKGLWKQIPGRPQTAWRAF